MRDERAEFEKSKDRVERANAVWAQIRAGILTYQEGIAKIDAIRAEAGLPPLEAGNEPPASESADEKYDEEAQ